MTGRCVLRWRRKQNKLDEINSRYERLRSVRQDAVYHHGWANSRGDYKEGGSHEQHVIEIDRKLEKLRKMYEMVEADQEVQDFEGISIEEKVNPQAAKDR